MQNKLFIAVSISAVVLFSVATQQCPADVLERLEQVEIYKWYPAQAEMICQQITKDYPGSVYALTAHKNLIISYLSARRDDDTAQTLNQLTADFAGNSGLPAALYDVAKVYERARKYETAKSLYHQIAQRYSDSSFAAKVKLDQPKTDILSCIESKKYNEVAAGIETLVNDFNDNSYLPDCLYDIARRYERAKRCTEAENLYHRIIRQYPESSAAESSRLAIRKIDIYSLIESGNETTGTLVDSLLAEFSGHLDLSEALYDIAIRFDRVKDYGRAKSIYQKITEKFPTSSHAARAPLDISRIDICSLIDSGDEPNASGAIDNLVADYSGHSHLPNVLLPIAKKFSNASQYQQRKDVYNLIIKHYPDTYFARKAELFRSKVEIYPLVDSSLHNDVNEAVVELIADFNDVPQRGRAAFRVGERYFRKALRRQDGTFDPNAPAYLRKAIAVFQEVISEVPDDEFARHAHYFTAICHRRLAEYEKAIESYRLLADRWPDYVYTGRAWYWIAKCYLGLKESGQIDVSLADDEIAKAYTAVVELYPDSKWAGDACFELARMYYEAQQWLLAQQYYQRFLKLVDSDDYRVNQVDSRLMELALKNSFK